MGDALTLALETAAGSLPGVSGKSPGPAYANPGRHTDEHEASAAVSRRGKAVALGLLVLRPVARLISVALYARARAAQIKALSELSNRQLLDAGIPLELIRRGPAADVDASVIANLEALR